MCCLSGLPAGLESSAGQVPYHMNIEIGASDMFSASPLFFFSTMYFLFHLLCIREFVFSLPLPKRSILPYIPYSSPCHSSSSSQENMSWLVQNKLFQKKPSSTEFGRISLPPPCITWNSRLPSPDKRIVPVLHRSCHQSCGWRKGWLLTTVKPGISEALHWAVNIGISA